MTLTRNVLVLLSIVSLGSCSPMAAKNFEEGKIAISAASSSEADTNLTVAAASSGWALMGCYTDSVSARSLPYAAGVAGGPTAMTNELCQSACLSASYTLAGTEYSDECYCGNALQNGGAPAPDGNTLCDMTCDGNTAETCGGPNRLSLYSYTAGTSPPPPTPSSYTLKATYDHTNFFSQVTFFTGGDPTHGYVDYLSQSAAQSAGLINTNNNQIYMGVDYTTSNPSAGRASVRVSSNAAWTHGLFIADIQHMPGGICGTWPAFWLLGANWPNNGEIDIIEGVNTQNTDSITLHTAAGCSINTMGSQSGTVLDYTDCNTANANDGCGVSTTNTQAYGTGFNAIGGGVYATQWTSAAIQVWFFPRNAVPSDISSGQPNPANWGTPVVSFNGGSTCNIDSFFNNEQFVFDTTFCGDWAGAVWGSSSCSSLASSCQTYVAQNPGAFQNAYWLVNSVKVYQE